MRVRRVGFYRKFVYIFCPIEPIYGVYILACAGNIMSNNIQYLFNSNIKSIVHKMDIILFSLG